MIVLWLFLLLLGSPLAVPQLLLEVIDPIGRLLEQLRREGIVAALAPGVVGRAVSRVLVDRVLTKHLLESLHLASRLSPQGELDDSPVVNGG